MGSFKQAALVTQLYNNKKRKRFYVIIREIKQTGNGKEKKRRRTTFPGLRFDLLQVEVSVVQQLKHLLRIPSVSFVAASSVWTIVTGVWLIGGY